MLDFPASPTSGQLYNAPNGVTYQWVSSPAIWVAQGSWTPPLATHDVINVTSFGTVGDGVTDDTAAIQQAINYAASLGGGTVYLPADTYAVYAPLTITTNGITLLGDNARSTWIKSFVAAGDVISVAGGVWPAQVVGTTIRNILISSLASKTAGHGISLRGVSHTTIDDVQLDAQWNGVEVYAANDTVLNHVNISSLHGDYGIKFYAAGDGSNRSDVLTVYDSVVQPNRPPVGLGVGFLWDGGAFTVRMYRTGLLGCVKGMWIQNTAGAASSYPQFGIFSDVEIDQYDGIGMQLDSGHLLEFANCMIAGSSTATGASVALAADSGRTGDMSFIGGFYKGLNTNAFDISAKEIRIVGVVIGDQRVAASSILLRGVAANITVADVAFATTDGSHNSTYGVELLAGASKCIIGPNNYTSLTTGDVLDNSGSTSIINLGGISRSGALSQVNFGPTTVGYNTLVNYQTFGGNNQTPLVQIANTGQTSLSIQRYVNGASNCGTLNFAKSQSATAGGQTIVSTTDFLGLVSFNGSDGTKFVEGAYIRADVDGTPGTDDMPTKLTFAVSADGTAVPVEAMRINNNRAVVITNNISGAAQPLTIQNTSTGATAQSIFQQIVGAKFVNRTLDYTAQYMREVGSNITIRYSDFDTHTFRNTASSSGVTIGSSGELSSMVSTAVGAGANTQAFIKASSTANLGIYYGTGVPSFTAAKGSLYSCTNATTTTTRLYVNTDGATTWANFTSSV